MNMAVMSHCAETHLSLIMRVRMVRMVDHCTTGGPCFEVIDSLCLFISADAEPCFEFLYCVIGKMLDLECPH